MAKCKCCSAPLPANTNRCSYCNVRNDVDLHGKHDYSIATKQSDRICPHCDEHLETIKLDLKEKLYIERCKKCYGLFFDPGEIETLLESSVSNVFDINQSHINNINKDRFKKNQQVQYVKCPECRILMNRVNFGHQSGVIIDRCNKHGLWLDNGEITHLMEWKKAGGELLHNKTEEKKKSQTKQAKSNPTISYTDYQEPVSLESELISSVSSLIFKLFR